MSRSQTIPLKWGTKYMISLPDIKLDDGTRLKSIKMGPDLLLNSVALLYGARNSGKTTVVKEMMYQVKNMVEEAYIISQSAGANNQFKDFVPKHAIKTDISTEWILDLLKKQKKKAHVMREYVDDTTILESLFGICSTDAEKRAKLNFIHKTQDYIEQMKKECANDYEMQMYWISKFEKNRDDRIKKLLRATIKKNLLRLKRLNRLNVAERTAVDNFNMNPHILLIFDDCASAMKEWTRKNPTILEAIYNGRHYYMTVIITAQADTTIDNKIRSNFTLVVYTDPGTAESNIDREHKTDKKKGSRCISAIWRSSNLLGNFKKLIYLAATPDGDPFRYCIMPIHGIFEVGSKAFWKREKKPEEQGDRA